MQNAVASGPQAVVDRPAGGAAVARQRERRFAHGAHPRDAVALHAEGLRAAHRRDGEGGGCRADREHGGVQKRDDHDGRRSEQGDRDASDDVEA